MAENYYHDIPRVLGEMLSEFTELNSKLAELTQIEGLSDAEIEDAWEGGED